MFGLDQKNLDTTLVEVFEGSPILEKQGLYISSKVFSRMLFMDQMYQLIVEVLGVMMDFGARWGNSLELFSTEAPTLMEVFGLENISLKRLALTSLTS